MKKSVAVIGLSALALGSTAAMAQQPYYGYGNQNYGGIYFGASAGQVFYNEDGLGTITPTIAMFRVGQQFNPYLAIEGRVGTSVNGDTWNGYHVDVQALYAGYIKGMVPVSPWVSIYALGGLGGAQIHRNYPDYNTNDVGFSYGVGGEFNFGGGASLNVEYARLTNGTNDGYNYNADMVTFGVNWHPW